MSWKFAELNDLQLSIFIVFYCFTQSKVEGWSVCNASEDEPLLRNGEIPKQLT